MYAGEHDLLEPGAATRSTSRTTSVDGILRDAPRVVGMMQ